MRKHWKLIAGAIVALFLIIGAIGAATAPEPKKAAKSTPTAAVATVKPKAAKPKAAKPKAAPVKPTAQEREEQQVEAIVTITASVIDLEDFCNGSASDDVMFEEFKSTYGEGTDKPPAKKVFDGLMARCDDVKPTEDETPVATPVKVKPEMTSGQENALESAQSYLDMSGFSKAGLIGQLSSSAGEGFSKADATFAANHAGANWNKEAVESAKSYLDVGGFSKTGLIDQLSSSAGEKFTPAQARYAANKVY